MHFKMHVLHLTLVILLHIFQIFMHIHMHTQKEMLIYSLPAVMYKFLFTQVIFYYFLGQMCSPVIVCALSYSSKQFK